jgi:hypothetical protein
MTKYKRFTGKVFGGTATATGNDPQISQFGSALAGTFTGTTDPEVIQSLPAWGQGWISAVTPNTQFPALPEMTGAMKVLSHQICGIEQQGISDWDNGTIYYQNNFTSKNGKIYISQIDENQGNDPETDTVNWKEFKSGGLPIGTVFSVMCTPSYVPEGALACDGTEYQKVQFEELWTNFLTAETPLLQTCTYEEYASDLATYGNCAKFAISTATLTFKVPTIKDGTYITQARQDSELGKSYNESLPNILGGYTNVWGIGNLGTPAGAFKDSKVVKSTSNQLTHGSSGDKVSDIINFNASNSSPVYQDNAPVQGNNVRLRFFVQVANGQIEQSQMDWSQWASSLQGKANTDLDNLSDTGKKVLDGQWVQKHYTISGFTASGSRSHDLSDYLPDDGYIYEVMFEIYAAYDSSSALLCIGTTPSPSTNQENCFFALVGVTSGTTLARTCCILPIDSNRILYSEISAKLSNSGIYLIGYRRVGTNV